LSHAAAAPAVQTPRVTVDRLGGEDGGRVSELVAAAFASAVAAAEAAEASRSRQ
jgi:hypothetical protein